MKCAGCHRDSPDVFIADGTGWMHWQCEIDRLTQENGRIADQRYNNGLEYSDALARIHDQDGEIKALREKLVKKETAK